jgi:peptidoglycan/LPS O-acetylase OafA/YrhL
MAHTNGVGPRGRRRLKVSIAVALGAIVGVALGSLLTDMTMADVGVSGRWLPFFDPWNATSMSFGALIGMVIARNIASPTRRTSAVVLAIGVLAGAAAVLASMQPLTTPWPVAAGLLLVIAGAGTVFGAGTLLRARGRSIATRI